MSVLKIKNPNYTSGSSESKWIEASLFGKGLDSYTKSEIDVRLSEFVSYTNGKKISDYAVANGANFTDKLLIEQPSGFKSITVSNLPAATTSENGLFSSSDKTKLNSIAAGATRVLVDSSLSSSSTNAIQNKAVYNALNDKVSTSTLTTKLADYALKTDITNVYKYKGSVATVSDLPAENNTVGDVYNVEERGINYAWNGTVWDNLGEVFTVEVVSNTDIDTLFTA